MDNLGIMKMRLAEMIASFTGWPLFSWVVFLFAFAVLIVLVCLPRAEICPDCGRQKARDWHDCIQGLCPKWFAVTDRDAARDCVLFSDGLKSKEHNELF